MLFVSHKDAKYARRQQRISYEEHLFAALRETGDLKIFRKIYLLRNRRNYRLIKR
jgi:hypothetical protein